MHVCMLCIHVYMHAYIHNTYTCIHACVWIDGWMDRWICSTHGINSYNKCVCVCLQVCCGIHHTTSSVSSAVQPGWVCSFPASKLLMNSLHLWYLNKGKSFLNFTVTILTSEDLTPYMSDQVLLSDKF